MIVEKIATGLANTYGELVFVWKKEEGKHVYEMWLADWSGVDVKTISKELFESAKKQFKPPGPKGIFGCPKCYSINLRKIEHVSREFMPSFECLRCGFSAPALEWEELQQQVVERSNVESD